MAVLMGPYRRPRIELRLAVCKVNIILAVLLFRTLLTMPWPEFFKTQYLCGISLSAYFAYPIVSGHGMPSICKAVVTFQSFSQATSHFMFLGFQEHVMNEMYSEWIHTLFFSNVAFSCMWDSDCFHQQKRHLAVDEPCT